MMVFGASIGSIGAIEEKMIRKGNNLHFLVDKNVQILHFYKKINTQNVELL